MLAEHIIQEAVIGVDIKTTLVSKNVIFFLNMFRFVFIVLDELKYAIFIKNKLN